MLPDAFTAATLYQMPADAVVTLVTMFGGPPPQPLPSKPPPKQNQKRLSSCFIRRHPSWLFTLLPVILSRIDMSPPVALNATQASTVKSPCETCRLDEFPKSTYWLMPLNENACATTPGANKTPLTRLPLLLPTMSFALPSPGHQLTSPDGGLQQVVGILSDNTRPGSFGK